jgi:hypothetical protein
MARIKREKQQPAKRKKKDDVLKRLERELEDLRKAAIKLSEDVKSKVNKLLKHPRNKDIQFTGRAFRVGPEGSGVMFTGLTHKLHDNLWPDTSDDPRSEDKKRKSVQVYKPSSAAPKVKCSTMGAKHGSRVHMQVHKVIQKFISGKKIVLPYNIDLCAVRILQVFVTKQWAPFCSELPIFNEHCKTATAIDFGVVDITDGRCIILELKNGYENQEYGPHPTDKKMRKPMDFLINCPLNRHGCQLGAMVMWLWKQYSWVPDAAYILRSCRKQQAAILIPMADWIYDSKNQTSLMSALCN